MNDEATEPIESHQMRPLTLDKVEISPLVSTPAVHDPVQATAEDRKSFRTAFISVAVVFIFFGVVVGSILRLAFSSTAAYVGMGVVFGLGFLFLLLAYFGHRLGPAANSLF